MAKTIEDDIDQIWSKDADPYYRPGSCKHWTEGSAESHLVAVAEASRLIAMIKADKELALLSDDESVSEVAREMLATELDAQQKKRLLEIETLSENLSKIDDKRIDIVLAVELSRKVELMTDLVKARPVEAITSPSVYVRKFAKKVIPSEQYKKLKKDLKTLRGRNK